MDTHHFQARKGVFALLNDTGDALDCATQLDERDISALMMAVDRLNLKLYKLYQECNK